MQEKSFFGLSPAGFHKVVYYRHMPAGAITNPVPVVCVHGLTRNGRDFDALAASLTAAGRVVYAVDIVGRGHSDNLPNPALYTYPQYLSDIAILLGKIAAPQIDWVGTSMGGLMGLMLAAQPRTPIRKLVLNDVGAFIPRAALERLGSYVGKAPLFDTLTALEAYIRHIHAPFGITRDEDWQHMAATSARTLPDGTLSLAYDPAIGQVFTTTPLADVNLWGLWPLVKAETLLIRGANSDLLLPETVRMMQQAKPALQVAEIPDCGHAPALIDTAQTSLIRDFLAIPPR